MKTLYIAIISGSVIALSMLSFFIMIYSYNSSNQNISGPIGAMSPMEPLLANVVTEPELVTIDNSFQIYATVNNTNPWPITFYDGCTSPLTVSFDKNVQIQNEVGCNAISSEVINPGQVVRVHGPSSGVVWNATTVGITNATITFSYQNRGNNMNITTYKQIAIGPPVAPPSRFAEQLKLARTYLNPVDRAGGLRLDCHDPIGLQMKSIDESVDVKKAIDLAYTSQEFVSKVNQYGTVYYNSFFNDWITGDPCNTIWQDVEVVFTGYDKNGNSRNIQVTEDIDLTKVLNVTDYGSGYFK
ncbi:exported protein of unknown function [Nitrosotalea devaniterrae]|uniref:Uncharacterized protein n=1 Tax=Nitrosotalea devaniterrae TaxID=1078905 RepID=A0A128A237_9ARCH|nr:exported protein of unknown function [Candidatus Nitrosotalea devanaterra]